MGNPAKLDELAIKTIRGLSMDAVQAANSGHPGTPMALSMPSMPSVSRASCQPAWILWMD